jgi:hypothetical protein
MDDNEIWNELERWYQKKETFDLREQLKAKVASSTKETHSFRDGRDGVQTR